MNIKLTVLLALLRMFPGRADPITRDIHPKFSYSNDFGYYEIKVPSSGYQRVPWYVAQDECRRNGAELFVFGTAEERDDIVSIIPDEGSLFWVGIHDIFQEGLFLTLEDSDVSESSLLTWDPTWNSTGEDKDCVLIQPGSGVIRADSCDKPADSICKIPMWKTYSFYPGLGYYKIHVESKSWADARGTCEREGSSLAVVNSEQEASVLSGLLLWSSDAFVGVHDQFKESVFYTVKGILLEQTGWSVFENGQPDNLLEQDCLVLTKDGVLRDESCFEPRPFICEHEI